MDRKRERKKAFHRRDEDEAFFVAKKNLWEQNNLTRVKGDRLEV